MRIAVISDTHMPRGPRSLPERCVAELRAADVILHGGDFMRVEVLRMLEGLGPPVHGVHGNVDDESLRRMLPTARVVERGRRADRRWSTTPGRGPGGSRACARASRTPTPWCSATRTCRCTRRTTDGFQIFNPGSPTERRSAPSHTMGIATVEDGRLQFELIAL